MKSTIPMFFIILILLAGSCSATPLTEVITAITPPSTTVDETTNTTIFSATCELSTYNPAPVNVQLVTTCTNGTALITPASFVLSSTQEVQDLQISVILTPGTNGSATLFLNGTWEQVGDEGEVIGNSAQIIKIEPRSNPYTDTDLDNMTEEKEKEDTPGFQTTITTSVLLLVLLMRKRRTG